jgi:hypothetical protein
MDRTMTDDKYRETLNAAADLQDSMAVLSGEIRALRTYGKRNRNYIVGLAVSLCLDLVLSIVVAFVAVSAAEANNQADQNRRTQIATCESSNQSRAVTVSLWNYVLDSAAKNDPTPQKLKQISDFRAYMAQAYQQRDCSQAGS